MRATLFIVLLFAFAVVKTLAQPCLDFEQPYIRYVPLKILGSVPEGERTLQFESVDDFKLQNGCDETVDLDRTGYLQGSFFTHGEETPLNGASALHYEQMHTHHKGHITRNIGELHLWKWKAGLPSLGVYQFSVDASMREVEAHFGVAAYAEESSEGAHRVIEIDDEGYPVALGKVSDFTQKPAGEWLFMEPETGYATQRIMNKLLRIYLNGMPEPELDSLRVFLGSQDNGKGRWRESKEWIWNGAIRLYIDETIDSVIVEYGARTARTPIYYPRLRKEESRFLYLLSGDEDVVEGVYGPAPIVYGNDYVIVWDWRVLIERYGSPIDYMRCAEELEKRFGIQTTPWGFHNDTRLVSNPSASLREALLRDDEVAGLAQVVEMNGEPTFHEGLMSLFPEGNLPEGFTVLADSLGFAPPSWMQGGMMQTNWKGGVYDRKSVEALNELQRRFPHLTMGYDWRIYHVELDD